MNRPLSIRARVTIAATAAVALVLIGGGVLTVAIFAQRERSSLDRELERRAHGPAGRAPGVERSGRPAPPPRGGPGDGEGPRGLLAESGSFVRVIQDGNVIRAAGDTPEDAFPVPERLGLATIESGGRKWRTLTSEPPSGPFGDAGEEVGLRPRIQFAADLGPLEDRIAALRTRVAVISALGIALAGVLASLLSGLALAPLSRLRQAVTGVSSTRDLSRRLPAGDVAGEVDELTQSMNAMLGRLERSTAETEKALEATRRFAADVGHELRTPLTSIRANLDTVRRNPTMPEAERQAVLEEVAVEQRELVTLLDALQALARGDAATSLPRERFDLIEIIDAAAVAARRRRPERGIELDAPEERQPLDGWPDGLRLLVENLIENAVRHGGSRVRVSLRPDESTGDLVLSVDDDGPGVPADERDRIFERFARGSAASAPGSGLGLALVAQQAALHRGTVDVDDSPLGGARFTVRLAADQAVADE